MIIDQHAKCCFCESKFSENSYGDVEHYRPKRAYRIAGARSLTYPGYYWLAYIWDNLMFSCEICNRKYKRNDFPLGAENTRKPWHGHVNVLGNEDSLLINPNADDPTRDFRFEGEVPVPVNGSLRGQTSIKAYGLERLNNDRMDYLILLEAILPYGRIDPTDNDTIDFMINALGLTRQQLLDKISQAAAFYNSAAKDTAKFAYCVRCKFPQLPTV